ncbi:hypothetical protein GBAR_LOCUS24753, partial [Geodia barretti]
YSCERNEAVKTFLLDGIKEKFSSAHSPRKLLRAVHRYYESRRRLFNDIQPGRLHIARKTKKKSRNKAHRKLLYERRKRVLKKEKERDRWTAIDFEYMTEESDGEEQVRQHKLP